MKYLLIILTISTLIISCKKETDNKFEPYFKLKANGNKISLVLVVFLQVVVEISLVQLQKTVFYL